MRPTNQSLPKVQSCTENTNAHEVIVVNLDQLNILICHGGCMRIRHVLRGMLFAIIAVIAMNANNSFGQVTSANCPGPGAGCTGWTPFGMTIPLGSGAPSDCSLTVSAQYRICGGVLQYQYLSYSAMGDCSFWKDSTLQQIVDLMLIEGSMQSAYGTSGLPICPATVSQVEFYIWQDCKYVTSTTTPVCTPPDNNPGAPPGGVVDVWTWHGCGNSCCKRTYNVCVNNSSGLPNTPANYSGIYTSFLINTENLQNINVTITSKVRVTPCDDNNGVGTQTWSATCNDGC